MAAEQDGKTPGNIEDAYAEMDDAVVDAFRATLVDNALTEAPESLNERLDLYIETQATAGGADEVDEIRASLALCVVTLAKETHGMLALIAGLAIERLAAQQRTEVCDEAAAARQYHAEQAAKSAAGGER